MQFLHLGEQPRVALCGSPREQHSCVQVSVFPLGLLKPHLYSHMFMCVCVPGGEFSSLILFLTLPSGPDTLKFHAWAANSEAPCPRLRAGRRETPLSIGQGKKVDKMNDRVPERAEFTLLTGDYFRRIVRRNISMSMSCALKTWEKPKQAQPMQD